MPFARPLSPVPSEAGISGTRRDRDLEHGAVYELRHHTEALSLPSDAVSDAALRFQELHLAIFCCVQRTPGEPAF